MAETDLAVTSRPASAQRISPQLRDLYVAYRRSAAELAAWLQVADGARAGRQQAQFRKQHDSALKSFLEAPSESVGDLALKLQVIKDEQAKGALSSGLADRVLTDAATLAQPLMEVQAQLLALQTATRVLLNSVAADPEGLARARESVMEIVEDAAAGSTPANSGLTSAAKHEIDALFTWID
ncbi:MAG TPA: hypothetical protein VFM42_05905 [Sphingomicrobium sp.]|nr:hypothetical protein [Sphingomicrobium sp.]